MDYYTRQKMNNILLLILFVVGVILQFVGHSRTGYPALGLQFLSLIMLLLVLYLYNRRHR